MALAGLWPRANGADGLFAVAWIWGSDFLKPGSAPSFKSMNDSHFPKILALLGTLKNPLCRIFGALRSSKGRMRAVALCKRFAVTLALYVSLSALSAYAKICFRARESRVEARDDFRCASF
jgi:hypothetical protein